MLAAGSSRNCRSRALRHRRLEPRADDERHDLVVAPYAFRDSVGLEELIVGAPACALDGGLAGGEARGDGGQVRTRAGGERTVDARERVWGDVRAQMQEQRQPAAVLRRLVSLHAGRPADQTRFALARPAGQVAPLVRDDEGTLDGNEIRIDEHLEAERIDHPVHRRPAKVQREYRALRLTGRSDVRGAEIALRSREGRGEVYADRR